VWQNKYEREVKTIRRVIESRYRDIKRQMKIAKVRQKGKTILRNTYFGVI
jgi:hypothetical protein